MIFGLASRGSTNFYPRPPRGGRRNFTSLQEKLLRFLSTPSARRATTVRVVKAFNSLISIHALREEGDLHQCH